MSQRLRPGSPQDTSLLLSPCPGQTLPQAPQLLTVLRSVHAPVQQPWPVAQALPQVPQSVTVSSGLQLPLQQSSLAAQALPQVPQLFLSLAPPGWNCSMQWSGSCSVQLVLYWGLMA